MFDKILFILLLVVVVSIIGILFVFVKLFSALKTYKLNADASIQNVFKDSEFRFKQEIQDLKNHYETKINTSLLKANTHLVDTNRLRLKEILDPFKENLQEFKKRNEDIHESQTQQVSELRGTLGQMMDNQNKLANEANNLAKSLRGQVKLQGMWGESILKQLLENSGLKKGIHYEEQAVYTTEDGQKQIPDFIIKFPDNKKLIIDAKVSLNSYTDYFKATKEEDKNYYLGLMEKTLKNHINSLASKQYQNIESIRTIDGVFLFIPIDALYFIVLEKFNKLFLDASKQKIYITSNSVLLPLLQVIESMWKTHNQNKNAEKMADIAGKIYDRCSNVLSYFDSMRDCIRKANEQLDSMEKRMATGRDNLVRNADKLRNLGANVSKSIPEKWLDMSEELNEVPKHTETNIIENNSLEDKSTDKGV